MVKIYLKKQVLKKPTTYSAWLNRQLSNHASLRKKVAKTKQLKNIRDGHFYDQSYYPHNKITNYFYEMKHNPILDEEEIALIDLPILKRTL